MDEQSTSAENHQCQACGRLFSLEGSLILHVDRMHSGARPYPCTWPDCEKSFPSSELLRKHLRNTHQPAKYICARCGAGFDLSEPYKIHLRQHDGIRPYTCSICLRKFTSRAVCRRHRASHNKNP
ncbi:zinc finger, C2H2 type [Ancylostoma caninum]|uniref:Zinc finger, C2H2 type n=1 Tax=Ancylostoma caninum TaxID=29170 RepID=A0A368EWF2_ANCCA|nr:zinc finger, C2H2 type [Ancylostoma caninum]